jgi:hypothetical protein
VGSSELSDDSEIAETAPLIDRGELVKQIYAAFVGVELEDGIGLWEAFGHDGYAGAKECAKLRLRDEKHDWRKLTVENLYHCNSSLSFFDAKGMRFHLPKYLLLELDEFDAEVVALHEGDSPVQGWCPEVVFTLMYRMSEERSIERFSLLNAAQLQCVIDFLRYQMEEKERYYQEYGVIHSPPPDKDYQKLQRGLSVWQAKLL